MTDKVQKIREEVERLRGWNNNVRNSTRHMTLQEEDFNRGKHSSYLEILNFIDSMQEEPTSEPIDFEQELYKAFGQVKDFTLGMRIAKWFYDMGKNSKEPVSEDLEEAVNAYIGYAPEVGEDSSIYGKRQAFKAGAQWQINKMIEDAIETSVMDAFAIGLHIEVKLEPNKYSFGDKVKLIIIKENNK